MKLEQAKCPNCGASIEYNNKSKENKLMCNYCHTYFIVDEITKLSRKLNVIEDYRERMIKNSNDSMKEQLEMISKYKWYIIGFVGFIIVMLIIVSI